MDSQITESRIYNPYRIFLYAMEHATSKPELVAEVAKEFGVDATTVLKWGSINESTRRRNPIGAILKLYKIFWLNCRPAAFQIQGAIKEMEMSLPITQPLPAFNALELIQVLRKATHIAEQLHAQSAPDGAYIEVLSEMQSLGSIFTDRVVKPRQPPEPAAPRKLTFNPRTPEAYR